MEQSKTFQAVNDAVLIDIINRVQNRLVFIAPGVRKVVAEAIATASTRLADGYINVILDVSAEVCRLGYGEIEGLKLIQESSGVRGYLSSQEGVRIGVVIADDDTLVYSPTPLYLEAEPEVSKSPVKNPFNSLDGLTKVCQPVVKPNGILLKKSVPENLADACSANGDYLKREIGMESVKVGEVKKAEASLAKNPPKRFDVTRQERVFSSQICFMELEVTDYRIAAKRLELPPEMFVMDDETQKRLASKFQVFDKEKLPNDIKYARKNGEHVMLSYDYIEKLIKDTRSDFLINVGKWGTVMLRSRMKEFDEQVDEIIDMLNFYKQNISEKCREIAEKSCERLADEVSDKLIKSPPPRWRNRLARGQTQEAKREIVKQLIAELFAEEIEAAINAFNPKTKKIEKSVTYETFCDEEFVGYLAKPRALGPNWRKDYFDEHDAIPEDAGRTLK